MASANERNHHVSPQPVPSSQSLLSSLLLSAAVVLVEAFSPHGADNLTIQVTASGLAALFIHLWG